MYSVQHLLKSFPKYRIIRGISPKWVSEAVRGMSGLITDERGGSPSGCEEAHNYVYTGIACCWLLLTIVTQARQQPYCYLWRLTAARRRSDLFSAGKQRLFIIGLAPPPRHPHPPFYPPPHHHDYYHSFTQIILSPSPPLPFIPCPSNPVLLISLLVPLLLIIIIILLLLHPFIHLLYPVFFQCSTHLPPCPPPSHHHNHHSFTPPPFIYLLTFSL